MPRVPRNAALLVLAPLALIGSGCQTAQYRAASLPNDMRASAVKGARQIHLPNLASAGSRSSAISPGDLLDVRVMSGLEDSAPEPHVLQVSSRGEIDIPLVGPVRIAGLEAPDASRAISRAAIERGVYRNPNITLEVREQATHRITVLGAVEEPGVHELPVGASDVLSAIAAAGGLSPEAGTEVKVMRQSSAAFLAEADAEADEANAEANPIQTVAFQQPAGASPQPVMQRIDLAMALQGPAIRQQLGDRDVVMVTPRLKRVIHVSGLVHAPDQFELPDDQSVRVLDAIAMAGGQSSIAADKVYVIRQLEEGQAEPAVIQVSIADAKKNGAENLVLTNGDLVSVESTVATNALSIVESFFRISVGLSSTLFRF